VSFPAQIFEASVKTGDTTLGFQCGQVRGDRTASDSEKALI
jgi:hypothetical protein